MREAVTGQTLLKQMAKALTTLERHAELVVRRWISGLANATHAKCSSYATAMNQRRWRSSTVFPPIAISIAGCSLHVDRQVRLATQVDDLQEGTQGGYTAGAGGKRGR